MSPLGLSFSTKCFDAKRRSLHLLFDLMGCSKETQGIIREREISD